MTALFFLAALAVAVKAMLAALDVVRCLPRSNDDMIWY